MDPELQYLLPQLKGAPGSVLAALLFSGRPLGVQELARLTGWSDTLVSQALRRLAGLGLVENTCRYSGWQLARAARPRLARALQEALARPERQGDAPEYRRGEQGNRGKGAGGKPNFQGSPGKNGGRRDAEPRRKDAQPTNGKPDFQGSPNGKPKFQRSPGDARSPGEADRGAVRGKLKSKRSPGRARGRAPGGKLNRWGSRSGKPKRWGSPYRKPTAWGSHRRKPKFHGSRSLKVVVDSSLKRLKLNTTTTPNERARGSPVEPILAAAQALFGERVFSPPGWKPDAGQLLGWIAAVYHRPGNLPTRRGRFTRT